ncbi:MAG TPA: GNAT family protein [Gaiellaceae bacterium]|nr:GNAT family protein [Gaiellaceae bacterium]
MKLEITPATPEGFRERATWRYEPPFELYDEEGKPVKNPERFWEARDEAGELVGFYYFERKGPTVKYGLGLRPDLTGSGHGLDFVRAGVDFARERFRPRRIVLDVFAFNERAVKVYERAGFRATGERRQKYRGREIETIDMELTL